MKPYKTLLILLVFMVLLYGPSLFHLESIHPGGYASISFPQIRDVLSTLSLYTVPDKAVTDTTSVPVADTAAFPGLHDITGIELPDTSGFYFNFLDSLSVNDGQTRILYYGDSQMEGDRISDYLRILMRESMGGTGPGLLSPTMLVPYTRTAYIRASANWERHNFSSARESGTDRPELGPLLSVSRFVANDSDTTYAWLRISPSASADPQSKEYDVLRVFYGNLKDSLRVNIKEDGKIMHRGWLIPAESISEYRYQLDSPGSIEVDFYGTSSPDLYGISIESDTGIVVDNIALRSSAGLEFSRLGVNNLRSSYNIIKPRLIVLHFGLNIVLNIKDDYSYYEENIFRQIEHLKSICPEAELLLISVTDMARLSEGSIHSYPNISLIVEAQRKAAQRAGVLFWDSWQAMGGEDAIVRWRQLNPPLASNDYTHITYEGGHRMAELLFKAMTLDAEKDKIVPANELYKSEFESLSPTKKNSPLKIIATYDYNSPLVFTSMAFWAFMLILLLLYSIIFKKPLLRNTYLFLFSLFFYYKSGGVFFILLIISTITDYLAGLIIYSSKRKITKKIFLFISLFVNLGMLAYFKYTGFFTEAINNLFGLNIPQQDWMALFSNIHLGTGFDISSIILPVGISFFTFQTISYTIDVYRNKTQAVRNILDFGFYVSFFPQLVAGPIVRASEFIPQLYQKFSLTKREWSHALFLIIAGLIKKIVVSDYIAANFVDNIFAAPGAYSGLENLLAVYGYGLQIYCDFSGYTDIAIGIALMLGFRLPVNFNSPYKAKNITDFWRRWHISLSRWLKDYLYISMGGNRKGKFRTNINLLLTMLLGGLWHGAAWRFIIWGGLHGTGLIVHKFWMRLWKNSSHATRAGGFISILLTFNFVAFCWIFFRAENMETVGLILDRIFTSFKPGNLPLMLASYSKVLVVMTAAYIIHFLPVRVKESYRGIFIKTPVLIQILLVYMIAILLYNIQHTDIQPFIYFRF